MGNSVNIIWVPSHIGIEQNDKAVELGRSGAAWNTIHLSCPLPSLSSTGCLKPWTLGKYFRCWNTSITGYTIKAFTCSIDDF